MTTALDRLREELLGSMAIALASSRTSGIVHNAMDHFGMLWLQKKNFCSNSISLVNETP